MRNRELVKISLENQAILNKINMTIPVYNHKQWLNDFKVRGGERGMERGNGDERGKENKRERKMRMRE